MKKLVCFALLALSAIMFVSCNNDVDNPPIDTPEDKPVIESITESDIVVMPNAQTLVIEYQSNTKCKVEIAPEAASWISLMSVAQGANSVVLDVEKNSDGVVRGALVNIISEDNPDISLQYSITQYADDSRKIYYTTTDGEIFVPEYEDKFMSGFGAEVKSHTYEGIGVIEFNGDVTTVGNFGERYPMERRLKSVYLPKGVTTIADNAFYECKVLEQVTLPETLESIGEEAFFRCNKLTNVVVPVGVREVKCCAFAECESLAEVTLPDTVEHIDYSLFSMCPNLTTVKLSNSITEIPKLCFYNCPKLEAIEIPESVEAINWEAFAKCASLKSILIPDNVKFIYYAAFRECVALESVSFPSNLQMLGGSAFSKCVSLRSVELPDSITTVEDSVFAGCSQLVDFNIPTSLKNIHDFMFNGCIGPEELIIHDDVERIGAQVFEGCRGIKRATIGRGVCHMYAGVFYDCVNLNELYCMPTVPPGLGEMVLTNCSAELKIYVPQESVDAYKEAEGWSQYKDIIVGYDF